jgi:hypothetical protein
MDEDERDEAKRLLMRREKDSVGGDGSGYRINARTLDDTAMQSSNRNKPRRMRSYVVVMDEKTLDL